MSVWTNCAHHLSDQELAPTHDKLCVFCIAAALLVAIEDYEDHNGRPKPPHWAATSRLLLTPLETKGEGQ